MLEHKQFKNIWHLQDLTRTVGSLSPLRTIWTSKRSCLSLPWIKINTRRNLAEFSFARSLVSSRNSWPCSCNRWKKKKDGRRQLDSRFSICPHTLSTKKIQGPASSKITQQKGSVNYREDSITHCGVAVVNSLPLQRPLIRGHCKST